MSNKYDGGIGQATHLLQFYLQSIAESAGWKWSRDNDSEVAEMVACLLNEARRQAREEIRLAIVEEAILEQETQP